MTDTLREPTKEAIEAAATQIHYEMGCTITAARICAQRALLAAAPASRPPADTGETAVPCTPDLHGRAEADCKTGLAAGSPLSAEEWLRLQVSITAIKQWQRHWLLRQYGDDGHVLKQNTELSEHIDRLLAAAPASPPAIAEMICGACGQPWRDGLSCGQKDNGHPFPTCYPSVASPPAPSRAEVVNADMLKALKAAVEAEERATEELAQDGIASGTLIWMAQARAAIAEAALAQAPHSTDRGTES
jgi:hypothetical protein